MGIRWSEYLDLLFVNNYEMDPSLSWQYFGSSSGFLRRYPGIKNFLFFCQFTEKIFIDC